MSLPSRSEVTEALAKLKMAERAGSDMSYDDFLAFKRIVNQAARAYAASQPIKWCLKHGASASGPTVPCKEAHVLAYRVGGNPFEPNRCRIVDARLIVEDK